MVLPDRVEQPALFMFFGVPGSGKTTLARKIQQYYPSVFVSSDEIAQTFYLDQTDFYHWTFDIFDHLVEKYLIAGYHVIADTNADKYTIRQSMYKMAHTCGANVFCFWVQAKMDSLIKRQEERKQRQDQLRKEHLFYVPEKELREYQQALEPPRKDETVYIIDGQRDLENQLKDIGLMA
ncbi:putative kinase [Melghiribacillus thermohalophilus]|uniref:Putative kinase n=1 Tax=Melghiribacillus thermohalophilus TaxID=1324956 RepID=A0A4R3MTW1_9BACI|nr:ATP-binding protein [Melghiribacillus thermohalophilus]TCT18906.1 putative kinase [Melghiribacillus thermohalophilus]